MNGIEGAEDWRPEPARVIEQVGAQPDEPQPSEQVFGGAQLLRSCPHNGPP